MRLWQSGNRMATAHPAMIRADPVDVRESDRVERKPDLMLVLMAVFGLGLVITLMLPMAANDTVAAPASELQAGVIIDD